MPRHLLPLSSFAVLTVVLTLPQVLHLSSRVGVHYDALFGIWRLAWIAHQLPRDPLHLFDANIFYPEPDTLVYSDSTLLLGLIAAPLIWLGASPVTVYNVLVLLSFVTAGAAAYLFTMSLQCSRPAAWFAAVAFAFQPYRFAHYSQLELLWTCWIPLAFWALHRALATRRVYYGCLLGLFVALQAWSCLYYAVFLVTGLAIVAMVLAWRFGRRDFMQLAWPAGAAVTIAAALIGPYAMPYWNSSGAIGVRSVQEVQRWSPHLLNYVAAQPGHWLYPDRTQSVDAFEGVLFPGITTILLALIGLFGKPRRLAIAYGILALIAFDLSLGFNGLLYPYLYKAFLPYQELRVPARFFAILSLALSVLACLGLASIRISKAGRAVATGFLLVGIAEFVSIPIPLTAVNPDPPRAYTWLARQPKGAVFEWPTPRPDSLGSTREPEYLYFSTFHWKPLVNGYSGHHPDGYFRLLENTQSFPAPDAIRYLRRLGVKYVVVHSGADLVTYAHLAEEITKQPGLRVEFVENVGSEEIAIYAVEEAK